MANRRIIFFSFDIFNNYNKIIILFVFNIFLSMVKINNINSLDVCVLFANFA